ncbi:MAG: metalloregulator ArsR/SmtB family transcription factor [Deltaproteobacteria bacterium]
MYDFEKSAKILKTLGHPLRLKIVTKLIKQPCCVKDIWGCLDMPQAVISQHLAILKASGIINGRRNGAEMHYTVIDPLAKIIVDSVE